MTRRVSMAGAVTGLLLGLALQAGTRTLAAQSPEYSTRSAVTGFEFRQLTLGNGSTVQRIRQAAIPFATILPFGRFTLDVGGYWASTTLQELSGDSRTLSSFTDTQVRGSYVFGRDAILATIMVNVPTGRERLTGEDQTLLGTVSSSVFAFPVNSYGNGTSFTAGLAGAVPLQAWNLGLAASMRVNAGYTPFVDDQGAFHYRSGVEGRFRVGADRLVGQSRVAIGITFSTFGDDEFTTGTGRTGSYRPGPRFIAEANVVAPMGNATLVAYAWNFHRYEGTSVESDAGNGENLAAVGGVLSVPLSRRVTWEPAAEGRFSNPEEGKAYLAGIGSTFRVRVDDALSVVPSGRFEAGILRTAAGRRHAMRVWQLSVFVRRSF